MRSDRTDDERSWPAEGAAADGGPRQDTTADVPIVEDEGAAAADGDSRSERESQPADAATKELNDMRDRYLRLAAEYDNYRKRTDRERADTVIRAQSQLVQQLLDAVDDLERVADYTEETTTVAALLEGVQMVERKLVRALEAAGLEHVEAHGAPFDPSQHEALMTSATESPHEDDTIGEVFQKGYRFQGHLLRPARVQVRKHGG